MHSRCIYTNFTNKCLFDSGGARAHSARALCALSCIHFQTLIHPHSPWPRCEHADNRDGKETATNNKQRTRARNKRLHQLKTRTRARARSRAVSLSIVDRRAINISHEPKQRTAKKHCAHTFVHSRVYVRVFGVLAGQIREIYKRARGAYHPAKSAPYTHHIAGGLTVRNTAHVRGIGSYIHTPGNIHRHTHTLYNIINPGVHARNVTAASARARRACNDNLHQVSSPHHNSHSHHHHHHHHSAHP